MPDSCSRGVAGVAVAHVVVEEVGDPESGSATTIPVKAVAEAVGLVGGGSIGRVVGFAVGDVLLGAAAVGDDRYGRGLAGCMLGETQ